jgi:Tol biopolymer transport system component
MLTIAGLLMAGGWLFLWRLRLPSIPQVRWRKLTTDNYSKMPPVLTDGSRLYFLAGYNREQFVAQVSTSGGQPMKLAITLPGPNCTLHDLSPDGQELLLTAGSNVARLRQVRPSPLWSLRIVDGAARRAGGILAMSAAYSPDGSQIAFSTESELYVAPRSGRSPRRVIELKDSMLNSVSWSPDGRHIRFSRLDTPSSRSAAWDVRTDGTGLHRLAAGWNAATYVPAGWTSDGKLGIFAAGGNFWAVPEAGMFRKAPTVPEKLTADEPEFANSIRPRSNVRFYAIGVDRLGELQRYDAASKRWVAVLDGISAEQAEYSRDGRRIAYVSYPERTLWVRQADGSRPIQFTSPPMVPWTPRWSPDARHIAFSAQEAADKPMRIYIVDTETGAIRVAVPSDRGSQRDPTWSPDGKKLLYGLNSSSAREDVYLRLADLESGKVSKFDGSEGLFGPRWSPDGSMVAALHWETSTLMLYRFEDHRWVQLSDQPCRWPTWSPDGKFLLYTISNLNLLMRYRVGHAGSEVLTELAANELGGFSRSTGVAIDGSPMRTLDHNSPQVYEIEFARR